MSVDLSSTVANTESFASKSGQGSPTESQDPESGAVMGGAIAIALSRLEKLSELQTKSIAVLQARLESVIVPIVEKSNNARAQQELTKASPVASRMNKALDTLEDQLRKLNSIVRAIDL